MTRSHGMKFAWLLLLVLAVMAGCKKLPNPVEVKDGQAWIPIAETAFLIPEKTWLKGYSRNSTDGMVCCISLHAMAPEVQPWSQAVHQEMYPKQGGWGRLIEIFVDDNRDNPVFHERFPNVPQSTWGGGTLVEEPSDLAAQGLRKFIELSVLDGQPVAGTVFYEYVKDGKVKYFAYCGDHGGKLGIDSCNLLFPYAGKFEVKLTFQRTYMPYSVHMADKVAEKLKEFEAAGQARLAEQKSK